MFAVGHISVAYLVTRGLNRGMGRNMSIPLVWAFSLLPDVDLLIPGLRHMGPTHSIFFALTLFLPLFLYFRVKAFPYFLGYASHTVLGDLITNRGVIFLWPMSQRRFHVPLPFNITLVNTFDANLELVLFGLFSLVFFLTKDYARDLYTESVKLVFLIPLIALLVPVVFGFPIPVPFHLVPSHLLFIVMVLQPLYPDSWMSFLVGVSERY